MKKVVLTCLMTSLLLPAGWMFTELRRTVEVTGVIIAMEQDQVKVGKSGATNRFSVSVRYPDLSANTIEVPLHYYVQAHVGKSITHSVRTVDPKMEGVYVILGAILNSIGLLFGVAPSLWAAYGAVKRFWSSKRT